MSRCRQRSSEYELGSWCSIMQISAWLQEVCIALGLYTGRPGCNQRGSQGAPCCTSLQIHIKPLGRRVTNFLCALCVHVRSSSGQQVTDLIISSMLNLPQRTERKRRQSRQPALARRPAAAAEPTCTPAR
jgi:hypothetical protein